MRFLAIKNFAKHQHYRDRNPPWIKLHRNLLTDRQFLELPEAAQAQLVKLWLLASQFGHPLPNNPRLLAGKIGTTGRFHLAVMISSGFLVETDEETLAPALAESSENARRLDQSPETEVTEESARSDERSDLQLVVWANKAVAERWGERPAPYTLSSVLAMGHDLRSAGVEWSVARDSIYRQCRDSKQPKPPRGAAYFRGGILEDWERDKVRRHVAANTEPAPPRRERPRDGKAQEISSINALAEQQHSQLAVQTRRARTEDGDVWWARMQQESGASNARDLYAYAAKHINEPGHAA